jgi:EAL domain-containing protein (putative c-di-GMP-specific phosphodiesterase class I)
LRSDRVVAVEALIRWQHPVRGLVSPAQFIPIAEKLGLIDRIGEWLLGEACTRFMAWQAEGLRLDYISVNVSPRQFRQRNFPDLVAGALRNADMPPERLQLEITESMLIDASGAADSTLALLVRLGVRLAIDDFGTGYSSLSYLKHLPVGTIKLDQSFIRDIATSEEARAIARSLIAMVQALRKEIVVEGVETQEQLALLNRWSCDVIQGNFLARPLSAAELLQFAKGRAGDKPTSRPTTTLAAVGG